jgi:hypothetical protein
MSEASALNKVLTAKWPFSAPTRFLNMLFYNVYTRSFAAAV